MGCNAKTIRLDTLKLNDRNPRTIKGAAFERLCESIKRDPQFMALRPIVVDEANVILGGNQRYRACQHLGMTEVPAAWVKVAADLTPEQRKRFVVVDNAPEGIAGEWDEDILAADWELPELEEMGFEKLIAEITAQTWESSSDTDGHRTDNASGETRIIITLPDVAVNQFKREISDACKRYNARMA